VPAYAMSALYQYKDEIKPFTDYICKRLEYLESLYMYKPPYQMFLNYNGLFIIITHIDFSIMPLNNCYFSNIIAHIIIHMGALQSMATAIGYLMPDRLSSSVLTTVIIIVSGVISGVPLNFADLKKIPGIRILSTLSPTRYLMLPLLKTDYSPETLKELFKSCLEQV